MKKTLGESILYTLLHLPHSKRQELTLSYSPIPQSIPLFFYRYPIYTQDIAKKAYLVGGGITLKTSRTLTYEHMLLVEYLYKFSEPVDNSVHVVLPLQMLHDEFGKKGKNLLADLNQLLFWVMENELSAKSFSLFDFFAFDAKNGLYHMVFSNDINVISLMDYNLPLGECNELLKAFKDKDTSILIRYALSMPYGADNGIFIESIAAKTQKNWSGIEISRMGNTIDANKKTLDGVGIRYERSEQKLHYDRSKYIQCNPPQVLVKDISLKKHSPSAKKEFINFEEVEMAQEHIDKAMEYGFPEDIAIDLFDVFLEEYARSKKKYKNLTLLWTRYLKGKVQSTPVESTENKGNAKNIIYNEDMQQISVKHGIMEDLAADLFIKFTNTHTARGSSRATWVPLWENYVMTHKEIERKNPGNTMAAKGEIENKFYLAQMVSEDIKNRMKMNEISISDVISGTQQVDGIVFSAWPLPPSMGKGKETLFAWADKDQQRRAMDHHMPKNSFLIEGK